MPVRRPRSRRSATSRTWRRNDRVDPSKHLCERATHLSEPATHSCEAATHLSEALTLSFEPSTRCSGSPGGRIVGAIPLFPVPRRRVMPETHSIGSHTTWFEEPDLIALRLSGDVSV